MIQDMFHDIRKYVYVYRNDAIFMMEMMTGKSKQTSDRHHFQAILSVFVQVIRLIRFMT